MRQIHNFNGTLVMRNILIFICFLLSSNISDAQNLIILAQQGKRLRIYTLPFIVKVLTFAP